MRVCDSCGTPVLDAWEYCRRCGGELAAPAPVAEPRRLLPAISLPEGTFAWIPSARAMRLLDRFRGPRAEEGMGATTSPDTVAEPAPRAQRQPPRMPGPATLPLALLLLPVALVVGLVLGAALSGDAGAEARAEVLDAQAATERAQTEAAQLRNELATANIANDELASELAATSEQLETLEARLEGDEAAAGALEEQIESLRERLADGQAALDESEQRLTEQRHAIEVLAECLSGTEVALAFARDRRSGSAVDRALEAVEAACEQARALR